MTSTTSKSLRRFSAIAVLFVTPLLAIRAARSAENAPAAVNSIDQIQFQQTNAQAQMEELQNRMFRLAELTRDAEPDDAAKLLMAVRSAQQQLILEQMRGNLALLTTKDFSHAADEQAQIIAKLEELKKLLTSGVGDLQMLLEKLRTLDESIKKLDAATTEEKRQSKASEALAAKPADSKPGDAKPADAKPADAKPLESLKQDQQQNRKATDSIAQSVKSLGGSATSASAKLGSASQAMTMAEGALGSGKPSFAQIQQVDAVDQMLQARKQLDEERDKVLAAVEKLVRKQIVMNLTEMLERQKSVRAGTELAVEHAVSAQPTREWGAKIRQLGETETSIVRIADQTLELIEQTHFSVALPPALKHVQQKIAVVAATLEDSHADAAIVKSEIQIERDLQDLLDTFTELVKAKIVPGGPCNCKNDKNKLEAELKVVRLMQTQVNDQTKDVDGQVGANLPPRVSPLLRDKIMAVHDGQSEVKDAMDKIHQQLTAPEKPKEQVQ